MFWKLGFLSAWRNLERSILALISMALAAGFMTNATSLSRGYAQMKYSAYRSIIGGEISAYSIDLSATISGADSQWQYQELLHVGDTDIDLMMPELLQKGYVSALERQAFMPEDIRALEQHPLAKAVYPRYQIPARSSGTMGMWSTPLRGRDLALDALQADPLAHYVRDGRWFRDEDHGEMVAVVMDNQRYPAGAFALGVGDTLQVMVPRIRQSEGLTYYDYADPLLIELRIVGTLAVPTRELSYTVYTTIPEPKTEEFRTRFTLQSDEILVPLGTWEAIWRAAGGQEYRPQQVEVLVDDLSYLEDTVASLRQQFPQYSLYSVPQLIERGERNFMMENPEKLYIDRLLREVVPRNAEQEQTVLALDLRVPMMALIFLNAALVVASNLLIMVNERKREIGVLKAVGATRLEVVHMVLSEALLISILGSLAGFAFFRLPAVFNQLTNGVAAGLLAGGVAADLALVLGVAGVASIVFGLIPALTMSNLSVQEVLQSE